MKYKKIEQGKNLLVYLFFSLNENSVKNVLITLGVTYLIDYYYGMIKMIPPELSGESWRIWVVIAYICFIYGVYSFIVVKEGLKETVI